MLLKFEAEAKSLRPRPKCPEADAEAEAIGYQAETETEAKSLVIDSMLDRLDRLHCSQRRMTGISLQIPRLCRSFGR